MKTSDTLTAFLSPSNATNKFVTWSCDPVGVIEFSSMTTQSGENVTVNAKAAGITTVKATSMDNPTLFATAKVTVTTATYSIGLSNATLSFGTLQTPYAQPGAITVIVTNTGVGPVTLTQPVSYDYEIGTLTSTVLALPGDWAMFTVKPKPGLSVGPHNEKMYIIGSNGVSAYVNMSFSVAEGITYLISATPSTLSFGSLQEGYSQPSAQTVTITNTGTGSVKLTQPTAPTGFTVGTLSNTSLPTIYSTATFTIKPDTSLTAGVYDDPITISGSNGASATVTPTFTVTAPITVAVTPDILTMKVNESQTFSAEVTGSSMGVSWHSTGGYIIYSGYFTAPTTPQTVTVTAISVEDPSKYGTATVNVVGLYDKGDPIIVGSREVIGRSKGAAAWSIDGGHVFFELFSNGASGSEASSVALSEDGVFVGGQVDDYPVIWCEDLDLVYLDDVDKGYCSGVAALGDSVNKVFAIGETTSPMIWTLGLGGVSLEPTFSDPSSIFAAPLLTPGEYMVYILGKKDGDAAIQWHPKGLQDVIPIIELHDAAGATGHSIFIRQYIYVAGETSGGTPTIWVGRNDRFDLPMGTEVMGAAKSVYASGDGVVYAAGWVGSHAAVWVNDSDPLSDVDYVLTPLSEVGYTHTKALAIGVTPEDDVIVAGVGSADGVAWVPIRWDGLESDPGPLNLDGHSIGSANAIGILDPPEAGVGSLMAGIVADMIAEKEIGG